MNNNNRNALVVIFAIALLLWGPIEPYGMVIRITYLIALPAFLWFILGYFEKRWHFDIQTNDRVARSIAGIIAGVFFVGAYLAFTSHFHSICTQEIMTRDGSECVGDFISIPGGDLVGGVISTLLGIASVWYSISKHHNSIT